MKAVVILLDSLNRRFLQMYGAECAAITPNFDRLAAHGTVFDNHWCGSAPCMPARRDMMTGRLNFLERPWGGIEPYDHTLPAVLQTGNVYSHIETDHYHYARRGGEDYLCDFNSWNLHRGAENDIQYTGPDKGGIPAGKPAGYVGKFVGTYAATKAQYAGVAERYSTARTLTAAADWLDKYHDADNFLLWAEGFDPHEPFDVPEEFVELYGEKDIPDLPYWPSYTTSDQYTEEQLRHFRTLYLALLSMADRYVGKILDVLDRHDLWKDTAVILTTDHGIMLGEHGYLGKNFMPDYNEVYRLPMIAAVPGIKAGRCGALTQNIDLLPTLMELFQISPSVLRNPIHGKSWIPVLTGKKQRNRDAVLYGTYAKSVCCFDGRYTYLRRTVSADNAPLYIYAANMNVSGKSIGYDLMQTEDIDQMEMGRFLPWTNYPVYRVPAKNVHWLAGSLRFDKINDHVEKTMLFDLDADPAQMHPIEDAAIERQCVKTLKKLMEQHDAPIEQYQRLGI